MQPLTDGAVFRRTLVVLLAVGFAVIIWRLTDLILLLLAGALVAFILFRLAQWIRARMRLPFALSLTLAVVGPTLFLVAVFWLFGSVMTEQFAILFDKLPAAFAFAENWLRTSDLGRQIMSRAASFLPDGGRLMGMVQGIIGSISTVVTSLVVVLIAGIYLAAQPQLYGTGVLAMVPPHARDKTVKTTRAVMEAISHWLKAQAVSMVFIGIFTSIALSLVGLPGAPAIGLVAGVCEFVPYLGTIVVAIPAIILGFSISPETGLWTLLAIVVVQQVQGNIVTPLVQASVAELPPALTIFSLIAFGVLMGPMGVILAVPLTVVAMTLVKELWMSGNQFSKPTPKV